MLVKMVNTVTEHGNTLPLVADENRDRKETPGKRKTSYSLMLDL